MGHARSRELVVLLAVLFACRPDTASDRAAILHLYDATRGAHLAHDSTGFVAAYADTVLVIANGVLYPRTRSEALANVGAYLRDRKITEVTDLDPPRIEVTSDGHSATLVGHVRVRGTVSGQPFIFTAAWLDLLRKDDNGWHIVVHANTEGP